MPTADTPEQPLEAGQPKYPLPALTTYELRDRRRELEHAIEAIPPDTPVQTLLREQLDAVLAEQEERRQIARANSR